MAFVEFSEFIENFIWEYLLASLASFGLEVDHLRLDNSDQSSPNTARIIPSDNSSASSHKLN